MRTPLHWLQVWTVLALLIAGTFAWDFVSSRSRPDESVPTPNLTEVVNGQPGDPTHPLQFFEDSQGRRCVKHFLGTTVLPKSIQRIGAMDFADELIALGVQPAAAVCSNGRFPDYLSDRLENTLPVYQIAGQPLPDFESLLQARLDVIITSNTDPQTYQQLSYFTAVIVIQHSPDIHLRLSDLGQLLNRQDYALAVINHYKTLRQYARERLAAVVGNEPVSLFRIFGRQFYIHGHTRGGWLLHDELDLAMPDLLQGSPKGCLLNPESLLQLNSRYLFIAAEHDAGAQNSWAQLLVHPVWQRVPAVRQGNVFRLRDYHQWLVPGVLARLRMMKEVLQHIVPQDPTVPALPSWPQAKTEVVP